MLSVMLAITLVHCSIIGAIWAIIFIMPIIPITNEIYIFR